MSNAPLRVFIGFDPRQPVAYQVAAASIAKNSSRPVSITPLILSQLPLKRRGLTEFTFSRFLVPYLCGYDGHALFVDADVLCLGDIAELPWDDDGASVYVVEHTSVQKGGKTVDVRFERPSVMLFNCGECSRLTPEYIETANPFSFEWASSIGHLGVEWNYLVGYNQSRDIIPDMANRSGRPKLLHFTQGIPIFEETCRDEYAAEWLEMAKWCGESCSWAEIMGNSVHAKWKQKPAVAQFMNLQGFG
jgi:hypothetical protein